MITAAAVPAFQSRVWAQLHHPKRHRGAGIGVAVTARADKGVYIINEFFGRIVFLCKAEKRKKNIEKGEKLCHC
jgi:hypothetical protein